MFFVFLFLFWVLLDGVLRGCGSGSVLDFHFHFIFRRLTHSYIYTQRIVYLYIFNHVLIENVVSEEWRVRINRKRKRKNQRLKYTQGIRFKSKYISSLDMEGKRRPYYIHAGRCVDRNRKTKGTWRVVLHC